MMMEREAKRERANKERDGSRKDDGERDDRSGHVYDRSRTGPPCVRGAHGPYNAIHAQPSTPILIKPTSSCSYEYCPTAPSPT